MFQYVYRYCKLCIDAYLNRNASINKMLYIHNHDSTVTFTMIVYFAENDEKNLVHYRNILVLYLRDYIAFGY